MKALFLIATVFLSSCSWLVVDVGVGYDANNQHKETRAPTHGKNPVGYVKVSVPVWKRLNLDYVHMSSIPEGYPVSDYDKHVTDVVGISYRFGGAE